MKYYKKKYQYKRKRTYRKRRTMNITRSRLRASSVYKVQRTFWLQNWTPNTTTTAGFWQYLTTSLSSLPDSLSYTNMFDQYKITRIKFTLRLRYDGFAGNDTTDTTLPGVTNQGMTNVHVIIDPTSSVTPLGAYTTGQLNSFLENGKVRSFSGTKPVSITVKYPCVYEDHNGVASSRFQKAQWYSTNLPGVQHRGAHVFLQDINMTGVFGQSFDIFVTMNAIFKGMK